MATKKEDARKEQSRGSVTWSVLFSLCDGRSVLLYSWPRTGALDDYVYFHADLSVPFFCVVPSDNVRRETVTPADGRSVPLLGELINVSLQF